MGSSLNLDFETSSVSESDYESPIIDTEYPVYWHGGYHPVHLGDLYDNGRYRIVHKIAAGDTSMIWLARDSSCSSWVALRIVRAELTPRIEENIIRCHDFLDCQNDDPRFITYTSYFHIDGPNGRHLCLVLPFCGPNLRCLSDFMNSRMKPRFARALAYKATKLLTDLHARGLCHGNLRPGNLLLRIRNLDHLDDQGIYHLFGQPQIDQLLTTSGGVPGPEAPRYVTNFIDFLSSGEDILTNEISLIGFDQAFEISSPRKIELLPEFIAPEVAVGKPASPASDIWALGVTILNMRSGISLFHCGVDCPSFLITECIKYFGELPASWEEPLYDEEGRPTTDKTRGWARELFDEKRSLEQWISDIWDEPARHLNENYSAPAKPFIVQEEDGSHPKSYDWINDEIAAIINYDPEDLGVLNGKHDNTERPFPEHYANRIWKPSAIKIGGSRLPGEGKVRCFAYFPGNEEEDNTRSLPRISLREAYLLHDLLKRILVYENRPSAKDILVHPWFRMGLGKM
ncbi:hypothetical protein IL306_012587 [Fusarium sp. DS 682]|nr:hypothetical protein IL306_012587 [Fusarium sp. DS 682]